MIAGILHVIMNKFITIIDLIACLAIERDIKEFYS